MLDKLRTIEALGVEVVPVATLTRKAVLVEGTSIALIRSDLTPQECQKVTDWILDRALDRTTQPRR